MKWKEESIRRENITESSVAEFRVANTAQDGRIVSFSFSASILTHQNSKHANAVSAK